MKASPKSPKAFAEKIQTSIWRETPLKDHAFNAEETFCRGYDFYGDLLGKVSWEELLFLQLRGELPSPTTLKLFNLVMVALANPGSRDWSTRAAMCGAIGKASVGNCLIAGLAVHQGQAQGADLLEETMCWLQKTAAQNKKRKNLKACFSQDTPPGFGWWYTSRDVRAEKFLEVAVKLSKSSDYVQLARRVEALTVGRGQGWLRLQGAVGALLLDLGFTPKEGAGIFLVAATSGLLAHTIEQLPRRWNEYPVYWRPEQYEYQPPRNGKPAVTGREETKINGALPALYSRFRGKVVTSTGMIHPGRADFEYMGHKQFQELTDHISMTQHFMLSATGKFITAKQGKFIEALMITNNYGDPRLWMHQATASATNLRCSPGAALISGMAVVEGEQLGPGSPYRAAKLLLEAETVVGKMTLKKFIERKLACGETLSGYGRPLVNTDERVPLALRLAKKYGYASSRYVRLARQIEGIVHHKKGIVMNFSGIVSAIFLEIGLTPDDIYCFASTALCPGMMTMMWEQRHRQPGTFLPMAVEDIDYVGRGPRALNRSR